jgi:hypothetical protein
MSCERLPTLLHHALRKNQGQQQWRQATETSTLVGPCEARFHLNENDRHVSPHGDRARC